jgi:hypothetical protein
MSYGLIWNFYVKKTESRFTWFKTHIYMPAAAVAIFRAAIQAAVTTGIWLGVDKILLPIIQSVVSDYMVSRGMSEEEAKDYVANDIIEIVAAFGAIAISIRTKFPTKVAEYLGFTSKGWGKRPTRPLTPPKKDGNVVLPTPTTVTSAAAATVSAGTAVSKLQSLGKGAAALGRFIEKRANTGFLAALVAASFIDFGNWETGAYSDFFQKVLATITGGILTPNEDYRKTKTVSPEVFDKVFNAYKLEGAVGINDPYKGQQQPFTRDNLIDLLDKVGADLLVKTGSASTKDVIEATQFLIVFDTSKIRQHAQSLGFYGETYNVKPTGAIVAPKVFTGIVSQGTLGRGLEFVPRQDDLIESSDELKSAAANNLAPFLQSLLGKIVYEVKIVNSVITKDGFRQTGTTQQVRSGTFADGKPKFKTVTNKFAVMDLFVLTDRGVRSKITTIVLGPTDSAKINLSSADLRSIESAIPDLVFTKDINEITGIETVSAITVSTPAAVGGVSAPTLSTGPAVTSATPVSTPAQITSVTGISALTLTDWFRAQGQEVPPVAARAIMYEAAGLGKLEYYTGTTEQNTKLLRELKITAINDKAKEIQAEIDRRVAVEVNTKSTPKTSSAPKTSAAAPKIKGVSVNTNASITEYGSGGAKIGSTLFTPTEYAQFKKARAEFQKG